MKKVYDDFGHSYDVFKDEDFAEYSGLEMLREFSEAMTVLRSCEYSSSHNEMTLEEAMSSFEMYDVKNNEWVE